MWESRLVIICLACTALAFGGGKTESSEYVNEDLGFAFEYPSDYVEEPVLFPNEITRLAKPNEYKVPVLTASVSPRSGDAELADLPGIVMKFMEAGIQGSSNFNVLEEKSVKLSDGSAAVIVQFTWLLPDGNTIMETVSIFAFNGDSQFTVTGNTIQGLGYSLDELSEYCMTMRVSL